MPEIDLGRAHQAEYRLEGLANIGEECGVHLAILDPKGQLHSADHGMKGELELNLFKADGQSVVRVKGELGEFTWWGFKDIRALYQTDRSYFNPDEKEAYRLRFSYVPDERLAGYKGFVYVRSGGSK